MKVGNIGTKREARNLRVVPIDRKGNWRIAQHAEVERIVRVLPDVIAADHEVLAKSLLQARMKLILEPRLQISRSIRASEERIQHRVQASLTGQHKVLVERRLQRPRIREPKNSVRRLDAVGNTQARL